MPIYELINPSDAYTFEAPDLTTAGVAACMLSGSFGAVQVDPDDDNERTPVLFGWDDWMKARGVTGPKWIDEHAAILADVFDSFLIGGLKARLDLQEAMGLMSDENRKKFRDSRQERHRTSMNRIGEVAYAKAVVLRKSAAKDDGGGGE